MKSFDDQSAYLPPKAVKSKVNDIILVEKMLTIRGGQQIMENASVETMELEP